eukprot:403332430
MRQQTLALANDLYNQSLQKIFKHNLIRKFGPHEVASVNHMRALCSYFGEPQDKFKSIHITGTNGKGTVCLKTANVLQQAGFKTGLLTSPHISTFRERITINQQKMSQEQLVEYTDMVFQGITAKNIEATFHEIVTMISFLHFAQEKIDYGVLECGLGGRLDPTNVISRPEVTAITSIGYDHMEYLGSNLETIAYEKAGIIKQGVPCIIGPSVKQDAVYYQANKMGARLIHCKKKNFLKSNQEIVESIIKTLGVKIPQSLVKKSCSINQPCRLERVPNEKISQYIRSHQMPTVYLDVCSNPSAAKAVVEEIVNRHPTSKISAVCGLSTAKDMTSFLHFLATHKHIKAIHPIALNHSCDANIEEVNQKIQEVLKLINSFERNNIFKEPILHAEMSDRLEQILKQCHKDQDIMLICGSYNMMHGVRQFFNYEDEYDQFLCQDLQQQLKQQHTKNEVKVNNSNNNRESYGFNKMESNAAQ